MHFPKTNVSQPKFRFPIRVTHPRNTKSITVMNRLTISYWIPLFSHPSPFSLPKRSGTLTAWRNETIRVFCRCHHLATVRSSPVSKRVVRAWTIITFFSRATNCRPKPEDLFSSNEWYTDFFISCTRQTTSIIYNRRDHEKDWRKQAR